jgi:hypothetical protein
VAEVQNITYSKKLRGLYLAPDVRMSNARAMTFRNFVSV